MTEIWVPIILLQVKVSWATSRLWAWLLEIKIRRIQPPNYRRILHSKFKLPMPRKLLSSLLSHNLLSPIKILPMWSNSWMISSRSSSNPLQWNRTPKLTFNRKEESMATRPSSSSTSSSPSRGCLSRITMGTPMHTLTKWILLRNSNPEKEAPVRMWTRDLTLE